MQTSQSVGQSIHYRSEVLKYYWAKQTGSVAIYSVPYRFIPATAGFSLAVKSSSIH